MFIESKLKVIFVWTIVFLACLDLRASTEESSFEPAKFTIEEVCTALTATLQQIQTYTAAYSVTREEDDTFHREIAVGWKRVPGSGLEFFDKRYIIEKDGPQRQDTQDTEDGHPWIEHSCHDGNLSYLNTLLRKSGPVSSTGLIVQGLGPTLWGRGLTLASLATHFYDVTPIERVVSNGTFKVLGNTTERGYDCVVIYGKYALREQADFEEDGPGQYVRLYLASDCGLMPVRQETFQVNEDYPDGRLSDTYTAELKEVKPGLWFPVRGTLTQEGVGVYMLDVTSLEVNPDIPEEAFRITDWPPGTRVEDRVANLEFRIPRSIADDLVPLLDQQNLAELRNGFNSLERKIEADRRTAMSERVRPMDASHKRVVWWMSSNFLLCCGLGAAAIVVGLASARLFLKRSARVEEPKSQ